MSLDQNLFTLNVTQRQDDRNVVDLIDPKGVAHYTKRRLPGTEYNIEVYDPLSESLLATVSAPSATSKHKTLQLRNPDSIIELKYTGTLSFRWSFNWEDHEFEWKREECYILRKPDPSVLIAVTKEPPGRLQTRAVQLLDYNLNRFDIDDRKGLEIVILTALLTFQDANETYHTPRDGSSPVATPGIPATPPAGPSVGPPAVPPRPEPRQGIERVAEMHAVRTALGEGDANEIVVWMECTVEDYAQYADRLLNDEAMLFISIRSASADQVSKVLRVVEETKRLRHKSGVAEEEELNQYVIYETEQSTRKGPKRINLDDPDSKRGKDQYAPPTSLTVHLSKIPMPELQPKAVRRPSGSGRTSSFEGPPAATSSSSARPAPVPELSEKERRNLAKKAEKERKEKEKESKKNKKGDKEHLAPSYHTPAHQLHPYQPSPSPSQLNNPAIYAAPGLSPSRQPSPNPRVVPPMTFPVPSGHGDPPPYGAAGGYNSMRMPNPQAATGSGSRPTYLSAQQQPQGRPSSFHQGSSGKGPVTAILDMWSKN